MMASRHADTTLTCGEAHCKLGWLRQVYRCSDKSRRVHAGLSWDELDMRTILVDPPRAGLDDETLQLLRRFERCADTAQQLNRQLQHRIACIC